MLYKNELAPVSLGLFIYSSNKYQWCAQYVSGTVLGTGESLARERKGFMASVEIYIN